MNHAIEEKEQRSCPKGVRHTIQQALTMLVAAERRYWSPNYIQHSAHIAPGRDGLFNLIKSIPPTLKYEPGTIVAGGDFCNRAREIFGGSASP